MGDSQATSEAATLNFDMRRFYEKWLLDMRDDQSFNCRRQLPGNATCGALADVTPFDGVGGFPGAPPWQIAGIVVLRNHWREYGDINVLTDHYASAVQLMRFFQRSINATSGLMEEGGYGDWMCVICCGPCARSPANQVGAFYFVQGLGFLAELAEALGKGEDAKYWSALHVTGRQDFHRRFYDASAGGYSPTLRSGNQVAEHSGSQTSNAMALALGATPDAQTRARVLANLVHNVAVDNDFHLTVGIMGMHWVLSTLVEAGRGDVALRVMMSDTFPSIG
jgi:alpha-L-rhamnosidase